MGSTSKHGRATINPSSPEAVGVCDRCGFLYNLRVLRFQYDWQGTALINQRFRVCPTCYDNPQPQKRTIILPPDPLPVRDVRLEDFFVDQINHYELRAPIGKSPWIGAVGSLEAVLTIQVSGTFLEAAIGDTGFMTADVTVTAGAVLSAAILDVGEIVASLSIGFNAVAAILDTSALTATLDVVRPVAAAISDTSAVTADVTVVSPVTRIYTAADVTGGQITIPSDYTAVGAVWHAIGGSADQSDPNAGASGGGCGAGAYAGNNTGLAFTPGASVAAQIGKADVWVSNTGSAPTSTSEGVLAKGGAAAATNGVGGAGGASASCIGTTTFSGGNGGTGNGTDFGGAGGGGAAGPGGAGRNGGNNGAQTSGAGGGGSNNTGSGSSGQNAQSATLGGAGGNNGAGSGGGTAGNSGNGGNGSNGGGGGGGGGASGVGGNGSMQVIWTDNSSGPNNGVTAGPSGGSGGGGQNVLGGNGQLYGGGAGGEGEDATGASTGSNGVLVVVYISSGAGADELQQEDGSLLLLEDLSPIVIDDWQNDVSAASALTGAEQIAVVQGGVTERTTIADAVRKLRGY